MTGPMGRAVPGHVTLGADRTCVGCTTSCSMDSSQRVIVHDPGSSISAGGSAATSSHWTPSF
jgi:hypothetical protein